MGETDEKPAVAVVAEERGEVSDQYYFAIGCRNGLFCVSQAWVGFYGSARSPV